VVCVGFPQLSKLAESKKSPVLFPSCSQLVVQRHQNRGAGVSLQAFTLRVPGSWAGCLSSEQVRDWLAAFLQRPTPSLPPDPGAGDSRVSLSLPKRAVKVVSGLLDETESAALRRIIAAHMGALPARAQYVLPAAPRFERGAPMGRMPSLALPSAGSRQAQPSRIPEPEDSEPGWQPGRVMPWGGLPASQAQPIVLVRRELPSMWQMALEVALWIGLLVLGFWLLIRLFRSAPKVLPAAAKASAAFLPWMPSM
jgi:hypothetical protein